MEEPMSCLTAGLEHSFVFAVAAFGVQVFQCEFCGAYSDVFEDCLGG